MLKESATGNILSYYNTKWITELVVDASPIGLVAILMQKNPKNTEDIRIIAYASRSLTDVKRRYAQIEKECLEIVWGFEKFHINLYGRVFVIKTDNKALEFIFKRSGEKTPLRIEQNPADFLSRKPLETECDGGKESNVELFVNYVFEQSVPSSITNEEVAKETANDPVLQELIGRIRGKKVNSFKRLSKNFDNVFHELTVKDQGVIMRGRNLVVPESLIDRVIDFYGPTPTNTSLLVIICDTSRFVIVEELGSNAGRFVIPVLHQIWVTFGIPVIIKTDNGPPFNVAEFENFCRVFSVKHRLISTYWPRANGEVEQFNRNLSKVMRNSAAKGISWKKELNSFLGIYRATPNSSTGQNEFESNDLDRKARENDENAKFKMKEYADKKPRCRTSDLEVEDLVWYKRSQGKVFDKKEPVRDLDQLRVVDTKGTMITAKSSTGEQVTRNSSCFKKIEGKLEKSSEPNLEEEVDSPGEPSGTLPRRSSRFGRGHIDKLQLNREKKSYILSLSLF
ncbi:unnamed protein product [Brachionus calyciflorus]|uniref:Integrase catalytic domain-containing protein n=1 Tax=Brachionus calyciflorus TaxID=104777 RepID=A0A813TS71_9BILA|nr:unnamed protein product [Brachionus calyciflorus]